MSMFPIKRGWKPKKGNGDSIKRRGRGRPLGAGKSPEPTVRSIRVTELVSVMLEEWKKDYHVETLDKAIRAYVKDHGKLRKKAEALEQELRQQVIVEVNKS